MKKMGDLNKKHTLLSSLTQKRLWKDDSQAEGFGDNVYIKNIKGPLFFGFADQFQAISAKVPDTATHVIIRMDKVPYMDQSGLYVFEDVVLNLKRKKIVVLLVGLKEQPEALLRGIKIIPALVPEDFVFMNFGDAMTFITSS